MADTFHDVGFLATSDLEGWRKQVREEFGAAFAIADRTNHMAMRMLWDMPTEKLSEDHVFAVMSFARAVQSFQGAILMAERGAIPEARALTRLCAEAVLMVAGLCKLEGIPDLLRADNAKHRKVVSNSILEANHGAPAEALKRYRDEIQDVKDEFGDKPKSIDWSDIARRTGLANLYTLAYRYPSGDGAHITMQSLSRHATQDADGFLTGFVYHPSKTDLLQTLTAANTAMVAVITLARNYMRLDSYGGELMDLLMQWEISKHELGYD